MNEKKQTAHEAHVHEHGQHHKDHHDHEHTHHESPKPEESVLTIRTYSGLSGDMFLAGLLRMTEISQAMLDERLAAVMPELAGSVRLVRRQVNHIGGWHTEVSLPHQHTHRTLADITALIAQSGMDENAKRLATGTFTLLARAEAVVHEKKPEEVHFHEVGALDSILDICMTCELFSLLAPSRLVVSPLPLADGSVFCAHGVIPVPAPAMLELLEGVPVRPFPGQGETVTPTAMALLRSLGAVFGPWPAMRVEKRALVYGTRIFADAPNGAVFAWGVQEEEDGNKSRLSSPWGKRVVLDG
ncbi:LarC family nickel insertion protein [Bilophila wadsworthia]|uniref:LarC family nickel insertion protein n=1 Tax=Bilophila wadsworthia TaxID=35833 RepID=UPI003AAAFD20